MYELGAGEWMQAEEIRLAHRKGRSGMQGDAEQRSRGSDMIAGCRLGEVLERGQGARIVLDLVEYDECALRFDRAPGLDTQAEQETIDVEVRGKQLCHALVGLEIDARNPVVVSASEFLEQPRLPDLPGPVQDEGRAMWISFPGEQIGERGSFYVFIIEALCTNGKRVVK